MSIFGFVNFKTLASIVPVLIDIFRQSKKIIGGGDPEIDGLKREIECLKKELDTVYKFIKTAIICLSILFLVSITALILGIISLSR